MRALALLVLYFAGMSFCRMATAQPLSPTGAVEASALNAEVLAVNAEASAVNAETAFSHGRFVPFEMFRDPACTLLELAGLMLVLATALAGRAYARFPAQPRRHAVAGTPKMQAVARAVREGGNVNLGAQCRKITISTDVFGPVADNAKGIGEMGDDREAMGEEKHTRGRHILADLDAVGNTTKAETKDIAIGSAATAAVSLFASFIAVIAVGSEGKITEMTTAQDLAEAGIILGGQLLAVLMANAGGAWDNVKEMIEDGLYGGKGSQADQAAVIGDTVGDPLKDTAGPAVNPLTNVMNLVSLLGLGLVIWRCGRAAGRPRTCVRWSANRRPGSASWTTARATTMPLTSTPTSPARVRLEPPDRRRN